MNEVFNLNRFARLFVKYTMDHYRSYLMSIAVLSGVMLMGGYFIAYMVPGVFDEGMQWTLFASILLLAGAIFTSTVFSDFGDKRKSVSNILLPASNVEKFLIGWIYSYVVFAVVYTGMFYLVLTMILYSNRQSGINERMELFGEQKNAILLLIYSILHAISIYGSLLFSKLHFIKTAFVFFIGYAVLITLNTLYLSTKIPGKLYPAIPYGPLSFSQSETNYLIDFPSDQLILATATIIAVTVLFWVGAYFRLKEKRV